VVFFREDLPEKTPPAEQPTKSIWASHHLLVGISVILIRQSGSILAGASLLGNTGEQLHYLFIKAQV
jgi:hypothetical protein